MKATGIVRRIDDLGRVVVPKEIRRTLRIREGDPLEIFTDRDGEIILKKYSPIGELGVFAQQFCESASQALNTTVCVSDHDTFIAAAGKEKRRSTVRAYSLSNRTAMPRSTPSRPFTAPCTPPSERITARCRKRRSTA